MKEGTEGNHEISKSGSADFITQIRRSHKRDHLSQLTCYDDGHETTTSYHFDQPPINSVKANAGSCSFTAVPTPNQKVALNSLKYVESSNIDSLTSMSAATQENFMM